MNPTSTASARRHGLPISVRGGGHDWAGRALREGGLVIDTTSADKRLSSAKPKRPIRPPYPPAMTIPMMPTPRTAPAAVARPWAVTADGIASHHA
jgi:hypothetical protein